MKLYAATTSAISGFPIKIGQTSRLSSRMQELQSGCPFLLDSVKEFDGHVSDSDVHFLLSDFRHEGEWFENHSTVKAVIDRLAEKDFQIAISEIRNLTRQQLNRMMRSLNCNSLSDLSECMTTLAVDQLSKEIRKASIILVQPGPPKTKGKDPVRSIRVPDEEWTSWLSAAHANGESVAATVRRLMNRWVKRQ